MSSGAFSAKAETSLMNGSLSSGGASRPFFRSDFPSWPPTTTSGGRPSAQKWPGCSSGPDSITWPNSHAYRSGSAFFVAQIDFSRRGSFGRLYATCNVDTAEPDPAYPQGNFLRLGSIPEARFDLAKVAAAAASGRFADVKALGADAAHTWAKTEGALAASWLDAEMIRTEGRWYSPATGSFFVLRSTLRSPVAQAVQFDHVKETVVHVFLNGVDVPAAGRLDAGDNALVLVYRLPHQSTHPERGGCYLRLTGPDGRRLENIRFEAK